MLRFLCCQMPELDRDHIGHGSSGDEVLITSGLSCALRPGSREAEYQNKTSRQRECCAPA
jgi:hypothetical protein